MSDQKRVSNDHYELKVVAQKLGVEPSKVLDAKEKTGSDDRKVIEDFLLKKIKDGDPYTRIKELIDVGAQHGNFDYSPYQLGLANGLIFAKSILDGEEPNFLNAPVDGFLEDKKQEG